MELNLTLAPVTWASLEAACEAVEEHPDDVLSGEAVPVVAVGTASVLLEALAEEPIPEEIDALKAAQLAGREFFAAAMQHATRATERVKRHADRCGVWEVMQRQAGGPSLARAIASHRPTDAERLRQMALEELLTYLGLRGVSEVSENLKDYL